MVLYQSAGYKKDLSDGHIFAIFDHVDLCRYAADLRVVQNTWSDVTRPELNAFVAIFLAMALNILPAISDYWSSDEMLGNAWIQQIMPRDRFQAINRYNYKCIHTLRYIPGGTSSQMMKKRVVSHVIWYVHKELEMPNLQCWYLLHMIDELRTGTFPVVPPHRWWRNGWYHMLYGMYRRNWRCQTFNA